MRIISGSLKGKSLKFLKNSTTRPLKDAVKENIFNILQHSNNIKINFKNSNVLDLYSGIGSFGIECLSRGVKKVTFIEGSNFTSKILKENLETLSLKKNSSVICSKIEDFLAEKKIGKFNIFFLDPPFADTNFIENLILLKKNNTYEKKHVIIIHRDAKTIDNLETYINIIITRKYGR